MVIVVHLVTKHKQPYPIIQHDIFRRSQTVVEMNIGHRNLYLMLRFHIQYFMGQPARGSLLLIPALLVHYYDCILPM